MAVFRIPTTSPFERGATVARWHRAQGDRIAKGQPLAELETETSRIELVAATDGILTHVLAPTGRTVAAGEPVGVLAATAQEGAVLLAELGGAPPAPVAPFESAKEIPSSQASSPSSPPLSSVVPVPMPQAGNTMEEGTIIAWRVKPGDRVTAGQVLLEIETDKATMEVESPAAGRIAKLLAAPGAIVPVQQPIALLADSDSDADAWLSAFAEATTPESSTTPPPAADSSASQGTDPNSDPRVFSSIIPRLSPTDLQSSFSAPPPSLVPRPSSLSSPTPPATPHSSPYARKVAAQTGIDLSSLGSGSGPGGRILSTDVLQAASPSALRPSPSALSVRRPLSSMRRAIAKNLQVSKQTVPHWYLRATIDADPMLAFYKTAKARIALSLNDIVILAVGRILQEIPAFRSRIEGNELVEIAGSNIGIAVGTDNGLVVPVICNVELLSLEDLALETRRLVDAARAGKIEGIGKAVFTISNMGMAGVEEFGAIINPPESGILAIGAIREQPIAHDGVLRAGRAMTITLSSDHRVVDGLAGAKFATRLKELLEKPENL